MMMHIEIQKKLHGSAGNMLLDVKLEIEKGSFVALMGESGSGKTTFLRVLAGLEKAESNIHVDGMSWNDMSLKSRDIGFVFQDYALFENMSVEENLLFVNNDNTLATELLEITELSTLKKRNVKGLSGGQKQRVSLCRALMNKPKILLMDEPFSALDRNMKEALQKEIKILHQRFNMTTIMVSHDIPSIYALANRVLVLKQGILIEDGDVQNILLEREHTKSVTVLAMREAMATVSFLGKIIEIEVDVDTKVGEVIDIHFSQKKFK